MTGIINVHRRAFLLTAAIIAASLLVLLAFVKYEKAQAVPEDWPAFTMLYEMQISGTSVGNKNVPVIELHRFEFQSPTEWLDTVVQATPVHTDYGVFSNVGSYQKLSGRKLTEFDAVTNDYSEEEIEEGIRFVPNGILVPFGNRGIEQSTGKTPTRVDTGVLVCFQDECNANAEGLLYTLDDGSAYLFVDDSRGFPLAAGNFFVVKELRIQDERR